MNDFPETPDAPETPEAPVTRQVPEASEGLEDMSDAIFITLLIDNSGSMTDEGGFASIRDFQRRLMSELSSAASKNNSKFRIRSLRYSDAPEWLQQSSIPVEEFEIEEAPSGQFSHFGEALKMVMEDERQEPTRGRTIWIWIGDGYVTDDWRGHAELLRTDPDFQSIERYSVHPEGAIRRSVLEWFAGAEERVISAAAADSIFHDLTIAGSHLVRDEWDDDVF